MLIFLTQTHHHFILNALPDFLDSIVHNLSFLHHFVLAKLATSTIRVKDICFTVIAVRNFGESNQKIRLH